MVRIKLQAGDAAEHALAQRSALRLLVHVQRDDIDARQVVPAFPAVSVEEAVDDSLGVRLEPIDRDDCGDSGRAFEETP